MKIRYAPIGINNFHNSNPINLIVSGKIWTDYNDRKFYLISPNQAKRIEKHFCGISDCKCPHGAAIQLDPYGKEFGINAYCCYNFS